MGTETSVGRLKDNNATGEGGQATDSSSKAVAGEECATITAGTNNPSHFSAFRTHKNLLESLLPKSAVEETFQHIHWSDVPYYISCTEFEQNRFQHPLGSADEPPRLTLDDEQIELLSEAQSYPMEYVLTNKSCAKSSSTDSKVGPGKPSYTSCVHKAQKLIHTCVQVISLTGQIIYCDSDETQVHYSSSSQSKQSNEVKNKQRRKIPSKKISHFRCNCPSRLASPFFRSRQSSTLSDDDQLDSDLPSANSSRHGADYNDGDDNINATDAESTSSFQMSHPMITEAQYAAAHEAELIMLIEADPLGILVHWSVHTLYALLLCLLEANSLIPNKHGSGGLKSSSTGEVVTLSGILLYQSDDDNEMSCASMLVDIMRALRACPKYDQFVSGSLGYVTAHMVLALTSTECANKGLCNVASPLLDLSLTSNISDGGTYSLNSAAVRVQQLAEEFVSWCCEKLSQSGPTGTTNSSYTSGNSKDALDIIMPTLLTILSDDKMSRQIFIAHGGIGYIAKHIRLHTPGGSGAHTTGRGRQRGVIGSNVRRLNPVEKAMKMERYMEQKTDSVALDITKNDTGIKRRVNSGSSHGVEPTSSPSKTKGGASSTPISKITPPNGNGSKPQPESHHLGVPSLSDASYTALVSGTNVNGATRKVVVDRASSFANSSNLYPGSASSTTSVGGKSSKTQQLYHLVFCLWALTLELLDRSSLESSNILTRDRLIQRVASDGAIPVLCGIVRSIPREKIVRVAMMCLVNLATANDGNFFQLRGDPSTSSADRLQSHQHETIFVKEMLACGLNVTLKNLEEGGSSTADANKMNSNNNVANDSQSKLNKKGRIKDSDVKANIQKLRKIFAEHESATTTQWDVYVTEVESGLLSWSSGLHTESFFRQNCRKMEGPNSDFYLVKLLMLHICGYASPTKGDDVHSFDLERIGSSSSSLGVDEEVLSVALFDVGEFVRHYPNGRLIAKQLGVTSFVMQLLEHESHDVQQQALHCVSKLLVSSRHSLSEG